MALGRLGIQWDGSPSQRGALRPKWERGDHSELESLIDKCLSFCLVKRWKMCSLWKMCDCTMEKSLAASFDECEACRDPPDCPTLSLAWWWGWWLMKICFLRHNISHSLPIFACAGGPGRQVLEDQPCAGPTWAYMQDGLVPKQVAISASPQNLSNFCPQGTLLWVALVVWFGASIVTLTLGWVKISKGCLLDHVYGAPWRKELLEEFKTTIPPSVTEWVSDW